MSARVLVETGLRQGTALTLRTDRPTVVGRASYVDLVLPDIHVSKTHCHISLLEGRWTVSDLGSSNGTFVNERRVKCAILNDGDVVRVGKTTLRFSLVAARADEKAPEEPVTAAPSSKPPVETGLLRLLERSAKSPEGQAEELPRQTPQEEQGSGDHGGDSGHLPDAERRSPSTPSAPGTVPQESERARDQDETGDLFSLIKKRIRRDKP